MSNLHSQSEVVCSNSGDREARELHQSQLNEFNEHQPNSLHQSLSPRDVNILSLDDEETEFMMTAFLSYDDQVDFVESEKEVVDCNYLGIFNRMDFSMDNRDYYRKYELDDEYELPEPRAPSTLNDKKMCDGMVTPTKDEFSQDRCHYEKNSDELDDLCSIPEQQATPFYVDDGKIQQNTQETLWSTSVRLNEHIKKDTQIQEVRDTSICKPVLGQQSSNEAAVLSDYELFYSEEELDDEYELPEPRAPSSPSDSIAVQQLSNTYGIESVPTRLSSPQYSSSVSNSANKKRVARDSELKQNVQRKKKMKKMSIGMPKRPVSAYNVFFQQERNRLYQKRVASKGASTQGRVGFQELGKIIGQKWKMLSSAERRKYEEVSQVDIDRYRAEVDECQLKRRKRIEALCDLKIPETTTVAAVSPTLSSDTRSSDIVIPPCNGVPIYSHKPVLHLANPSGADVIDLTAEVSTAVPVYSSYASHYGARGTKYQRQNTTESKSAQVIPVQSPFTHPIQNNMTYKNPKTGWMNGPSCTGRDHTNFGAYQYREDRPNVGYYGAYYDHGPFESNMWNANQYHDGSYTAHPYSQRLDQSRPTGLTVLSTDRSEGRLTPPHCCDSSIITTSSSPLPTTIVSGTDEDDGSACSASTIISEGDKPLNSNLHVLYAPTLTRSDSIANQFLPLNAMEVKSNGGQNMRSGCHLPLLARNHEPNVVDKKVFCSVSGRWYNVEYKCYRMKSSEANVYLSKLNGST
jgi:HMG-box domain